MNKLPYKVKLNQDLLLFYLLWPIIIAPKEVQFVVIFIALIDLIRRHRLYFDTLSYVMIAFITIYIVSIVYNLIVNSYELDRILATINTFSMWVFSIFFYLIFKVIRVDIEEMKKIAFTNYCILIILWSGSLIVYWMTNLPNVTILNREIYYTEWFGNMPVIRFVGFMDYPNLIIMFFMFFYPLYFSYIENFKNKILKILLMTLGLLPIITTFSRSGYVIVLIYLVIISIYFIYQKINKKFFISIVFFTLSIGIVMIFYTNTFKVVLSIFQELFNAREGSNNSRTYLMMESIRVTLENSPIVGMGIKVTSLIGYPLGSHSTYVGFFYKTGIAGFILGLTIFIIITLKLVLVRGNRNKTIMKISLLMMPLLFIVEDIDGANWLMIFYFLLVATILNKTITIYKDNRM